MLYGRRGTGKTHALVYLAETLKQKGDLAVYVDLRNAGSSSGIYSDYRISVSERATRLILDTLAAVHDELVNAVLGEDLDLSLFAPLLDEFAKAITEVQVHGQTEEERTLAVEDTQSTSLEAGIGGSITALKAGLQAGARQSTKTNESVRIKESGTREYRVHFGRVGNALKRLSDALATRRIWILLDEWSGAVRQIFSRTSLTFCAEASS